MIFTLELNYRNCPFCKKKVPFAMDKCRQCHQMFPPDETQKILAVQTMTRQRMQRVWDGQKTDPQQVRFSKFYLYSESAGYHHIFGIPLYTVEEVLVVQNLMYRGAPGDRGNRTFWIASFCRAEQPEEMPQMRLRSWQALYWDERQQIWLAGNDEGAREVAYTTWE
jgi:hypothetical protein